MITFADRLRRRGYNPRKKERDLERSGYNPNGKERDKAVMSRCLTAKFHFANDEQERKRTNEDDKRERKHTKERNTYVVGAWSMAQTMHRTCDDGGKRSAGAVWQAYA